MLFFIYSAIWDLGEYCEEKQSQYQKMGIQGRWQVTPDVLEPPHKKSKVMDDSEVEGIAQMKVGISYNINYLHYIFLVP